MLRFQPKTSSGKSSGSCLTVSKAAAQQIGTAMSHHAVQLMLFPGVIATTDCVLSFSYVKSQTLSITLIPPFNWKCHPKPTMPEPGSKIINHPSDSEMRIRSRWDALADKHPSAADLDRCTSEVSNYKTQQWKFCHRPFRLSVSLQSSQAILPSDLDFTTDECYDFCWKSCAVYCVVDPDILGMRPTMLDFFHAIWRCWFKGDETDVS